MRRLRLADGAHIGADAAYAVVTPVPPPPPASGPSTVFEFSGPLSYPVRDFTTTSKYVLYDNGAFALQYPGSQIVGSYQQEGAHITFLFAAEKHATGNRNGDFLEVRYNELMRHSDFEDAVYKRSS